MNKVYVFLADGFEDVEALIPVDVLRRGGVDVVTVSTVEDSQVVESAHGVQIVADALFEECEFGDADLLLLPGGMPGSKNLNEHEGVRQALVNQHRRGRLIGAICAAPIALHAFGVLDGKTVTGYPGSEKLCTRPGLKYTGNLVEHDGNIVTGKAPGATPFFAAEIARALGVNEATVQGVLNGMFVRP